MAFSRENIRLIFGLKIKQLRLEKKINLSELANLAGVSVSYLNEIEKGKKYPKSEKIFAIAEALDTDYDSLVSLKLSKKLEPIAQILTSSILTDLPLEIFGVEPADLFDLLSSTPDKLSAFISTITAISRNYDVRVEQFFFSVLRSYQEMHDNYFPALEEAADNFLTELNIRNNQPIDDSLLSELLTKQYGYKIEFFDENSQPELMKLRSIVISKNGPKLFINKRLTTQQRAFTYGREIGYQYLKIKTRPLISSVVEATSFEQVLGNFQASYFAGAILINRKKIIKRLDDFFQYRVWNSTGFLAIMDEFCCTPEVFLSRLTNVMPSHFKINELFFFRFNNTVNNEFYYLNKELHLAKLHPPHGTDLDEHYCRRWASITTLQSLVQKQIESPQKPIKPFAKAQISDFSDDGSSQYFVITMAMPSALNSSQNSSVTVGFLLDEKLRNTILFLKDPSIIIKKVGETCERCSKLDCIDRVSPSNIWQKKQEAQALKEAAERLI